MHDLQKEKPHDGNLQMPRKPMEETTMSRMFSGRKGSVSRMGRARNLKSDYWTELRKACYARDNNTCRRCLKVLTSPAAHHIVPFFKGGEDKLENLMTVCRKCHRHLDNEYIRLGLTHYMRRYIRDNKVI